MNIDKDAQLIARKEIVIYAPCTTVWGMQADIDNWPNWQKDISYAKLEGPLKKGTRFRWKAMGIGITSYLQQVKKDKVIGWTGDSVGMHAVHIWKFEKQGDNTFVKTEESLSGWLPTIIKLFKADFLEESLAKSLETLKFAVEKKK